jgi:hypothetical protein
MNNDQNHDNGINTVTYTSGGGVTNNCTWIRIGYRIYSLWRFTAAADYYYWENLKTGTGSFSDLTDGTALRRRLNSRTHWRRLTHALA